MPQICEETFVEEAEWQQGNKMEECIISDTVIFKEIYLFISLLWCNKLSSQHYSFVLSLFGKVGIFINHLVFYYIYLKSVTCS